MNDGERTPPPHGGAPSAGASTRARVLIVDDEFSIAETLAEILAFEGYEVTTAPDGARALEEFDAHRPDVVVTDYMMPVMNGIMLCAALREKSGGAALPILLMSAAPLDRLPMPRLWSAALQKPFEAPRLIEMVAALLHGGARGGPVQ